MIFSKEEKREEKTRKKFFYCQKMFIVKCQAGAVFVSFLSVFDKLSTVYCQEIITRHDKKYQGVYNGLRVLLCSLSPKIFLYSALITK